MTYFTTGAQLQAALNALPNTKTGNFVAFDSFFYGQQYMADYQGTLSPIEHFVQIGAARGYKPNATFDPTYYKNAFADLKNTDFNAADLLYHFMQYGLDEGRIPSEALATFDGTAYLAANPDVAAYVNANLAQFGGSVTNGALAHYVKFGASEGRPAPGASTDDGKTVLLTRFTDVKVGATFNGYLDYNQYTGQDEQTLTTSDRLTGTAADNDTLYAQQIAGSRPTLNGIEIVSIDAKGVAPVLDLSDANGVKTVINANSSETANLSFTNLKNLVNVVVRNTNADTVVTFNPTVVAGTADALSLTVDGAGVRADRANVTVNGIETLNVTASGAASVLGNVTSANVTKVTVSGDQNLSVGTKANGSGFTSALVATVDAAAATGNLFLNVSAAGATNQTITTGAGNDTVVMSGLTANDTVDLGAGTNRVVLTDGGSNQAAKLTNVQQIEARAAGVNLNLVNAPSVNLIAIAETAVASSIANVTSVKSGTTFAFEGEGAANAIGAANTATFGNVQFNLANATGSTDVINVTYNNAGSMLGTDGVVTIGTLTNSGNNVETMNLTFSDVGADDTVNVADIIVGADGAGNSALRTITVTSDSRVNLGTGGATLAELDDLTTFDATGVKGALNVTLGQLATNASATVKTGGAGNSTVVVDKANDAAAAGAAANTTLTVDASAGTGNQTFTVNNQDGDLLNATTANFVFVGGAGNDTLTLTSIAGSLNNISGGKGADIINLAASAGVDRLAFNVGDSQLTAMDVVTGFKAAGADVIDLRSFGFDVALQGIIGAAAALNGTANEFGAGAAQRAVAAFSAGGNTTLYVDVNGDARLDANDLVVSLVGTAAVVVGDIQFA